MKKNVLILFMLYLGISDIFSQNLSKITVTPSKKYNLATNVCKDGKLGIIVFYSAIKNLEFEAKSPLTGGNAIVNREYKSSDNCYVLCVQPQDAANFSIKITGDGFYSETCIVGSLSAKEKKIFEVTVKQEQEKDLKVIAGFGNGVIAGKGTGLYGELKKNINYKGGLGIIGGYGSINGSVFDHWSIGAMGFYNLDNRSSLFVSGHYGTLTTVDVPYSYNSGSFTLPGEKTQYGISVLGGYEHIFWNWFHITAGIGGSYTLDDNPKFMFAWNVGIGVSIIDFFRNL